MIVDLEQLAELAFAEAQRHPARSAPRRAAGHLWIALTIPPARSLDAAKSAIASFGTPQNQADALALMHQPAATATEQETPA